MHTPRLAKLVLIFSTTVALSACGGGGGDEPTPTISSPATATPEGAYSGTLTGSSSANFQLLMLENNEFWTLYGSNTPAAFVVDGFIQGSGTATSSSYSSADVKDFGYFPARAATLAATYNSPAGTVNGTFTDGVTAVGFSGNRIPAITYNYDAPAVVASISGAWTLQALTGETMSLNVSPTGVITGTTSLGCSLTGSVIPRPSGKNVFNLSVTFGAAPCVLALQTATGIALSYPLTSGGQQLLAAVKDGARTAGVAVFGVRP